jgi:hypothetical protein
MPLQLIKLEAQLHAASGTLPEALGVPTATLTVAVLLVQFAADTATA